MTMTFASLTRRKLLHAGLAVPAGLALTPTSALAKGDLHTWFEAFLARVPVQYEPFQLAARRFEIARERDAVRITAVVQLTWPPGRRSRSFAACEVDEDRAFEAICTEIETYFVRDLT